LIDEFQHQREHEVAFDGEAFLPGVYFCVLKTDKQTLTKKLIKL